MDLKSITRLVNQLSAKGLVKEVQMDDFSKLLKYLESFVNDSESWRCFPLDNDGDDDDEIQKAEGDEFDSKISSGFYNVMLVLEHISLAVLTLNTQDIPQHIYPEELLINSLDLFKSIVDKVLVPALEFTKDANAQSRGFKVFTTIVGNQSQRQRMLSFVTTACHLCHDLSRLPDTDISDNIIVKLVYLGLALFFIDATATMMVGPVETESLKLSGTNILRQIFTKYPTQRLWILEEILSSLIKLPYGKKIVKGYRLADGSKIHSSTALIMQLIQACTENAVPGDSLPKIFFETTPAVQRTEVLKFGDLLKSAADSVQASMTYVFKFLLSRSTKNSKSSIEADYRAALDCLVNDLLTVLGHPEWPVAEQCLYVYSTSMVRFIDDTKSELHTRTMAVDSLGMVAAKVNAITLRCKNSTLTTQLQLQTATQNGEENGDSGRTEGEKQRLFYGELNSAVDIKDLVLLKASYNQIVDYLQPLEWNDRAIRAAKCAWAWQWAHLLCTACSSATVVEGTGWPEACWCLIAEEIMKLWRILAGQSLPQAKTRMARTGPLEASEYLTSRQPLFQSFDLFLSRILLTLEGGVVSLRAKSLKSLSLIVTGDHGVLSQQNVRKTIALRLQDASPAVRDAAIDLVGKYMLEDKNILKAYYEIISDRLSDTGVGVRKRVIRLLKDIFAKTELRAVKNDIAKKILWRVKDDEPTVRELAIKTAYEIWFGQFVQATQSVISTSNGDVDLNIFQESPLSTISTSQKRDVLRRVRTLVDAIGQLPSNLVDAFGYVLVTLLKKESDTAPSSHGASSANTPVNSQVFSRVCHVLVDCLVDLIVVLQEEDGASKAGVISTMHTLNIFSKAEPHLMTIRHLTTLQTYLVGSSTADDWRITMHVLKIYLDVIPTVQESTSLAFAQSVEKLLSSLLSSCPLVVVPDSAHALCLVIRLLTFQSSRLSKLIRSCVELLKSDLGRFRKQGVPMVENKTRRLLLITGYLCQHFPFDKEIEKNPEEPHLAALSSSMKPSVHETVFNTLLSYFSKDLPATIQQTALKCIGCVFYSFPTLMNTPKGIELMDSVFEERSPAHLFELLQHFYNYLIKTHTLETENDPSQAASEIARRGTKSSHSSTEVKTTRSLMAKAEDHLEAGIASAVMQRYLDRILQCALMPTAEVQSMAVDVITIITQQALVHPMLCMPAIVALETSHDKVLSDRVFRIHKDLHHKHASLIYAKSLDCIRSMYLYQKQIQSLEGKSGVQGYKVREGQIPESLLNPMYSLVSEKRQVRQTLLLGLVKLLDIDLSDQSSKVDPTYIRFLGELLATLEYRTVEEILFVIFYLNRVIAGAGITLLEGLHDPRDSSDEGETGIYRTASSINWPPSMTSTSGKGKAAAAPSKRSKRRRKGFSNDSMVTSSSHQRSSLIDYDESGEDEAMDSVLLDWYNKTPESTLRLLEKIAQGSIALETVILVKSHLKHVYDISEARCQQFQPSAQASHKEKPHAVRATPGKLPWNRTRLEIQLLVMKDLSTMKAPPPSTPSQGSDTEYAQMRAKKLRAIDIQLARFRRLMEAESVDKWVGSPELRPDGSGGQDDIVAPDVTEVVLGGNPARELAFGALRAIDGGADIASGEDEEEGHEDV
ncbi:Sister chromatid cohesion protein 2 [Actinomortierella wolfii]|nr:Sister chromatid cohesion protein 2 [Actinomortierella wolfii]